MQILGLILSVGHSPCTLDAGFPASILPLYRRIEFSKEVA